MAGFSWHHGRRSLMRLSSQGTTTCFSGSLQITKSSRLRRMAARSCSMAFRIGSMRKKSLPATVSLGGLQMVNTLLSCARMRQRYQNTRYNISFLGQAAKSQSQGRRTTQKCGKSSTPKLALLILLSSCSSITWQRTKYSP